MPLLALQNVTRRFGGVVAVDDVSLVVEEGEIAGLIGPNGAGKTTLFNVVTGLFRADAGEISFAGESILGLRPHRVARRGIARTFQNVEPFRTMTVREHVQIGAYREGWLGWRRAQPRVREVLALLELGEVADQAVTAQPFGTLKRVDLARALASRPRLLLLDEPAGGLIHEEVEVLARLIRRIKEDFSTTIVLVEHHMALVMEACDRVHVLDFGRKIAEGTPAEVQQNDEVIEAYLGVAEPADRSDDGAPA